MIYLAMALSAATLVIEVIALRLTARGRITRTRHYALNILGSALLLLAALIIHSRPLAGLDTALIAINIWGWWNDGGGDGTKKRLRKLARTFTPVRRTAPQGT